MPNARERKLDGHEQDHAARIKALEDVAINERFSRNKSVTRLLTAKAVICASAGSPAGEVSTTGGTEHVLWIRGFAQSDLLKRTEPQFNLLLSPVGSYSIQRSSPCYGR
jgi:hypothetical protein